MAGQKLRDAIDAALTFVRYMDLAGGRDQVAIVRFDSEAEVVHGLSGERAVVEEAVRSLQSRQGTRIDRGLRAALTELHGERRSPANSAVLVILTDGIQTIEAGAEIEAAREVRDAGVWLYAIGLGDDVDEATMLAMVEDERRYFFAPDSSHLRLIYEEVARDLRCPGQRFWP